MHMLGEPRTMQDAPHYDDVVAEVHRFLAERLFACEMSGIARNRLLLDPGFGFGKTLQHNLLLLRQLSRLSRKRMIGDLTGRTVDERVHGSIAAAVIAVQHGAAIVRVHDVAATRDALAVAHAVMQQPAAPSRNQPTPAGITWPDDE